MTIRWAKESWRTWDKVDHVLWCYAGWLTLAPFLGYVWATGIVILVALIVETVQRTLKALGFGWFADDPSWRDLVADAIGIVLAFIVFCLGAWFGR